MGKTISFRIYLQAGSIVSQGFQKTINVEYSLGVPESHERYIVEVRKYICSTHYNVDLLIKVLLLLPFIGVKVFIKIGAMKLKWSSLNGAVNLKWYGGLQHRLSFDTIVALKSENSILNKSVASFAIHFFATVTTGYPYSAIMVGTKPCPFYVILCSCYKSEF